MERDKALEMALGQIEKQFGKGAIMRLGEKATWAIEAIPTGALALDLALGIGGLPRGRVVEIFGPESSGKSTLAMHVVAEAQRNGGICAYIDAEHAMDPVYAEAIGVNVDELLISQPDTGEQALEIADMLIRSGALDVIVIDSVAALVPRAEIEGEMGDTHVGLQARLMSQALRKLTGNLNRSNTICIFINQLREKIGVMFGCFLTAPGSRSPTARRRRSARSSTRSMPVEVLSYDPDIDSGRPEEGRQLVRQRRHRPSSSSSRWPSPAGTDGSVRLHANHQIRTPGGWREAQELTVGDRVLQSVPHHLSDFQWEVVLGGLMGDGALSPTEPATAPVPLRPRRKQAEYGDWKASLFANIGASRSTNAKGAVFHDVQPLPELAELRRRGLRRGQEGLRARLPQAAHAALPGRLVHGRRRFHAAGKGCPGADPRTAAAARRSASRRWSPTTRSATRGVPGRHLGDHAEARRACRQGGSPVPEGRDGEAARADRAVRALLDGVQVAAALPRSVRSRAGFTTMRHELMPMPITQIG